jgi:hypothetical protein
LANPESRQSIERLLPKKLIPQAVATNPNEEEALSLQNPTYSQGKPAWYFDRMKFL